MTALKASLRRFKTTSPTERAVSHWRKKLLTQEKTPESKMATVNKTIVWTVREVTTASMPYEINTGKTVSKSEMRMMKTANSSIMRKLGRKDPMIIVFIFRSEEVLSYSSARR